MSGFISLQFGQFANTVAYGAGLAAFVLGYAAPRTALWGAILATAVWLIAAPWLTPALTSWLEPSALPYSWNARIEIWDYVIDRIRERPWFGHGLDAARAHLPAIPVHPHSASLQIWFELGIVGVALAAATLLTMGRDLARRTGTSRAAAAAAAGTLAATGTIANLSFNLWAEWWFATFFIASALVAALAPRG